MKIYVEAEEICEYSEHENKKFGEWSEEYSFNIRGVYSTPKKYTEEFDLDVKKGDSVYALILRYSTGDSFGTAIGKGELIWLFSEKEFAERVYFEYMNGIQDSSLYLMLEIENKQFKRTKIGNVISGYFEQISSLDIEEHKVM